MYILKIPQYERKLAKNTKPKKGTLCVRELCKRKHCRNSGNACRVHNEAHNLKRGAEILQLRRY